MAAYRSVLSGLVFSAVVLTGLSAPASTAQTPASIQPPSLVATQGSTAAAPLMPAFQSTISDSDTTFPTKSPTEPPTTLPDPTTSEQTRANEVSNAVAAIASQMPGHGGTWVDDAGMTHVAVQPGKSDDVQTALGERFKGEYVLDVAKFSYSDLVSRRNSISEQLGALKTQGLDLLEWGPDEKNNTVWISLRNFTAEKADLARKILGDDVIVKPAAVAGDENDLYSRTDDWQPYSAGIFLGEFLNPYPFCTSGMPIVINGNRYLVSAGHCFDPALGGQFPADVYNGGTKIGKANWADFSQNGVDAAVINAPGSFTLYRTETSFVSIGTTPWNSLVGQTICSGGAFSGEKCALPVIAVNYCSSYYPNRITCGVSTAGKDGAEAAGHGDSGGPMYILSPSQRVSGIVVAAASPQFTCSRQGPVPPGVTRTCSSYVRFQTASSILSYWGTTM